MATSRAPDRVWFHAAIHSACFRLSDDVAVSSLTAHASPAQRRGDSRQRRFILRQPTRETHSACFGLSDARQNRIPRHLVGQISPQYYVELLQCGARFLSALPTSCKRPVCFPLSLVLLSTAATSFHVTSQISAKSDMLVVRLVPIVGPAKPNIGDRLSLSFRYSMVLDSWPSRHYARVHLISAISESLFPPHDETIVEVSGAGLSHVCLALEALPSAGIKWEERTFHLNEVDTLCADVDRTTSSWSFRKLTHRIRLSFPSPERLDGFLFTLSHIRISQAYCLISRSHCPVGWSPSHEVPVERHLSEVDLNELYVIRATAYTHAHIHVLPAELLSEIFLFFRPSSAQYRPWESPLLLLQICSAWRSAAIGTPRLWHNPSFTLDPSFLRTNDGNPSFTYDHHNAHLQMLHWLTRARSVPISLSLTFQESVHPSGERFDSTQSSPSSFDGVRMLALYCTQPQLQHFFGDDAPLLPSLETFFITVPKATFRHHRPVNLFRTAPLLRSLAIETERSKNASRRYNPDLVTGFPWSRLTTLSLQVELRVSNWIPIFFQCLSLQSGSFILRQAPYGYPLAPTIFPDLVSLRITFVGPSDTRFFDHIISPVLRELHITAGALDLEPMPILPALRVLILDAVVPELVLQRIISAHPKLLELSVKTLHGGVCPNIWGLRYLRVLTICTSISDPDHVQLFTQNTAARVVQAVSAGCGVRIFAEVATLDSLRIALADERAVKVSTHCDPSLIPSPKPVDRVLPPRLYFFLAVERLPAL